jgi:hypothetical protein
MMNHLALAERGVDALRFQNSSPLSSLLAKERGEETAAVALAFNISKLTMNERYRAAELRFIYSSMITGVP